MTFIVAWSLKHFGLMSADTRILGQGTAHDQGTQVLFPGRTEEFTVGLTCRKIRKVPGGWLGVSGVAQVGLLTLDLTGRTNAGASDARALMSSLLQAQDETFRAYPDLDPQTRTWLHVLPIHGPPYTLTSTGERGDLSPGAFPGSYGLPPDLMQIADRGQRALGATERQVRDTSSEQDLAHNLRLVAENFVGAARLSDHFSGGVGSVGPLMEVGLILKGGPVARFAQLPPTPAEELEESSDREILDAIQGV